MRLQFIILMVAFQVEKWVQVWGQENIYSEIMPNLQGFARFGGNFDMEEVSGPNPL